MKLYAPGSEIGDDGAVQDAAAALAVVTATVVAVIYTHSHVDHFGGVKGVADAKDVAAGKVKIVAPAGFMAHAVSENVLAGNVMSRRATYMYGSMVPKGPHVDAGLGKTTSNGELTLIAPTGTISKTEQKLRLAGIEFVFLDAINRGLELADAVHGKHDKHDQHDKHDKHDRKATVSGDQAKFDELLGLFDKPDFWFPIVTP